MKANELMIGDWVLISIWDCNPFPSKVTSINYNSYRGKDYVDWIDTEDDEDISMYEVQPIPLTPEILEKNGFEKVPQKAAEPCYWQLFDYETSNVVDAFRRIYRGMWVECSNATTESSANKQCEYVHELQHALKLCGIEKEIVL